MIQNQRESHCPVQHYCYPILDESYFYRKTIAKAEKDIPYLISDQK